MEMYRYATINDLELLVCLRLRDLKMYSNKQVENQTIENIREFYKNGINGQTLKTILCYKESC